MRVRGAVFKRARPRSDETRRVASGVVVAPAKNNAVDCFTRILNGGDSVWRSTRKDVEKQHVVSFLLNGAPFSRPAG